MDNQDSVKAWAKTADFPQPIRWGWVEEEILARPPALEDMPPAPSPPGPAQRALGGLATGGVGVLVVALCASPLIGLGIVLSRSNGLELTAADGWVHGVRVSFLAALALAGWALSLWLETRRRSRAVLALTPIVAVASIAALFVSRAAPGMDGIFITIATTLAGVLALAAFVLTIVASKPGVPRPSWGLRRPKPTPEQHMHRGARAQVLEVLLKRGLIDRKEVDIPDMVEMPIGTWHRLDRPQRG